MHTVANEDSIGEIAAFTGWAREDVRVIARRQFPMIEKSEHVVPAAVLPRIAYVPKAGHLRLGEHWGQLKLLLSEIEFLSEWFAPTGSAERSVVIYAGAAPGVHIPFLARLVAAKISAWVLVDPAPFSRHVLREPNIEARRELFTDALAEELRMRFAGWRIFFISDIRRDEKSEERIAEDMAAQAQWVKILRPHRAMLKFRLPYVANDWRGDAPRVLYLAGRVVTQAFAAVSATEARLITNTNPASSKEREYDAGEHEKQMFALNLVQRAACSYMHPLQPWRGTRRLAPDAWDWSYSYDTARMFSILMECQSDNPDVFKMPEVAQHIDQIELVSSLKNASEEKAWRATGALALACFAACGGSPSAKRRAQPDGVLLDLSRAERFRRKCLKDYEMACAYFATRR